MKRGKAIKVQIYNSNNNYASDVLTKFHAKVVENCINELSISNDAKVEVIDKIIETIKLSGMIN